MCTNLNLTARARANTYIRIIVFSRHVSLSLSVHPFMSKSGKHEGQLAGLEKGLRISTYLRGKRFYIYITTTGMHYISLVRSDIFIVTVVDHRQYFVKNVSFFYLLWHPNISIMYFYRPPLFYKTVSYLIFKR